MSILNTPPAHLGTPHPAPACRSSREIAPWPHAAREFADGVKSNKVLIERAVKLNVVPFPGQPEFRPVVAVFNGFYQFFLAVAL